MSVTGNLIVTDSCAKCKRYKTIKGLVRHVRSVGHRWRIEGNSGYYPVRKTLTTGGYRIV